MGVALEFQKYTLNERVDGHGYIQPRCDAFNLTDSSLRTEAFLRTHLTTPQYTAYQETEKDELSMFVCLRCALFRSVWLVILCSLSLSPPLQTSARSAA